MRLISCVLLLCVYFSCGGAAVAKGDLVNLNVRVPRALKELIQKIVEYKLHANISEFARDALREKIQRDAPELYRKFYEEVGE